MSLYLGLMSGTSADGIDAALVELVDHEPPRLVHATSCTYEPSLRAEVLALYTPGVNEIDRMGAADAAVGDAFAAAALECIAAAGIPASAVRAIGSHGQTVRHRPGRGGAGFTLQIGDPNRIAERTGIDTVADFRRRDMAAGGQGAPLASGFHQCMFGARAPCGVVNIGGIANVTCFIDEHTLGFDTGPGNAVMDAWIARWDGSPFDRNGALAASGAVDTELLTARLAHPYFTLPAPKSTGREEFTLEWLLNSLHTRPDMAARDVQATLLELTAQTIAQACTAALPARAPLWICGGGVHNGPLLARLQQLWPEGPVASTAEVGVDPDWMEAIAFAWLARQRLTGRPGNVPQVTGARRPVQLGALYPGADGLRTDT